MNEHEYELEKRNKQDLEIVDGLLLATDDLPILSRLEMVETLLFNNGGCRGELMQNAMLVAAHEILGGAIRDIRREPKATKLFGASFRPT